VNEGKGTPLAAQVHVGEGPPGEQEVHCTSYYMYVDNRKSSSIFVSLL
jgi:hypothetical protein